MEFEMERGQADAHRLISGSPESRMEPSEQKRALASAIKAARLAGKLIRANLSARKTINSSTQHDIKIELDVRCQRLIEKSLHSAFPSVDFLGEEGLSADVDGSERWVVDPIDGTVNFAYGIPHACVSIAMQRRVRGAKGQVSGEENYRTIVGVV